MNLKKISSVALATLMLSTGVCGLTVFADSSVNSTNTNLSYSDEVNKINNKENFTEKVMIDDQEYVFNHKFSGDLHTIEFKGRDESGTVTTDSKTDKLYVNGENVDTIQTETINDKNVRQERGTWVYQSTYKFKLNFIGSESKAAMAAMIAVKAITPVNIILGGISVIYGASGFCSFSEKLYFNSSTSRSRKYVLGIYSDRNWSQYEGSVTHYDFI